MAVFVNSWTVLLDNKIISRTAGVLFRMLRCKTSKQKCTGENSSENFCKANVKLMRSYPLGCTMSINTSTGDRSLLQVACLFCFLSFFLCVSLPSPPVIHVLGFQEFLLSHFQRVLGGQPDVVNVQVKLKTTPYPPFAFSWDIIKIDLDNMVHRITTGSSSWPEQTSLIRPLAFHYPYHANMFFSAICESLFFKLLIFSRYTSLSSWLWL